MCGISGVLVSPSDLPRVQVDEVVALLVREMESRGREATGVARLTVSNRIRLTKNGTNAGSFLAKHPGIGAGCRLVITHTRQSTKGSPRNNANNHPIFCGDIVGVHNGIVYNDDELYTEHGWNRAGEVDSEAIFAAINNLGPKEAMEQLQGSIACAWMDKTDMGALWIARHTGSPMNVGVTEGGSVVFASTNAAVAKAAVLFPGGVDIDMIKEGVILRCVHDEEGKLDVQTTEFKRPVRVWTSNYSGGTGPAGGFRRETVTPAASTGGNVRTLPRREPSWVVGGDGYLIRPNAPVVFVPLDEEYPDIVGTFVDASFKTGYAYVRLHMDYGVSDEVSLPVKQLYPLDVWREDRDKITPKGAFGELTTGLPAAEDDEDDMLKVIHDLSDDTSERAEQFWNAIMQAEADDNETLANALVLAYDAGMEIAEWVNDGGDIEAPDSLTAAIEASMATTRQLPALERPREVSWDDVIDVTEVD